MATEKCLNEVRAAIGEDGKKMTDEEIGRYFEQVHLKAERLRRDRVDLSGAELLRAAADEAGAEARMTARIESRNAKMNQLKRLRVSERLLTDYADDPVLGLNALLGGVNTAAKGNRLSIAAQQAALKREWIDGFTAEFERAGLLQMLRSGEQDLNIARELFEINRDGGNPGVSGVPAAQQAAEIINKYQKLAVSSLNKEGAWVGHYDGFIASTAHDPDAVRRGGKSWWRKNGAETDGFAAWKNFIESRLDDRTFDDIADRDLFLRRIWNGLVDGVHLTPEGLTGWKDPAFTGPANLAKKLSQGRKLHFRDADSWHEYFTEFGGRQFGAHVLAGLDASANAVGLMRELGTNPRAEFEALKQRVIEHHHQAGRVDLVQTIKGAERGLNNLMDVLDGTSSRPVNSTLAQIGGAARAWQSMSKLGGVTLSAIADVPVAASEMKYQGVNLLQAYGNQLSAVFRGRGSGEQREIADLLLAGFEGMRNHALSRISEIDAPPGAISKAANTFFRWSGLTYWTDAQRVGAEMMMARHLGQQRGVDWAALPAKVSRVLEQFRLGEPEWAALHSIDWAEADGRTYLTPDRARLIGDDAVETAIGGRLDDIRSAAVERVASAADRLDKLEEALTKSQGELAKLGVSPDDIDRALTETVMTEIERRRKTIGDLRAAVVDMRDGKLSALDVNRRVARETERLSRDARLIGDRGRARVERLKDLIPQQAAERDAIAARLDRIQGQMLTALDDIADAPGRLEHDLTTARDGWRDDLALKLRAYFVDRGEYAVLTPGARERAWLTQGLEAGTAAGEALRCFMQFKAFPVAVVSKVWGREVYGGERGWGRAAGMVHLAVATTAFGYLAMTAKDLFKGQTPRDPTEGRTWAAAFVQGGGAGIYGDFLFGSFNRFGRSLSSTLLGPSFGAVDDIADLYTRARDGDDLAAAGLRFAMQNTPYANLFYIKPALDYLFLYQAQEALNPGFLRRMERSVKEKTGKTFLVPPSRTMPVGGGDRWFEGVRE